MLLTSSQQSNTIGIEVVKMGKAFGPEMETIYKDFLRNQGDIVCQLKNAIAAKNYKAAHRLVHTAKSLANLMHERPLADISKKLEAVLRKGTLPSNLEINEFEREATYLLKGITEHLKDSAKPLVAVDANFDKAAAKQLFVDLEAGLLSKRGDVLDAVDALAKIPHTSKLIENIEDFEFVEALGSLATLKEKLGV